MHQLEAEQFLYDRIADKIIILSGTHELDKLLGDHQ
jgi:hypothetical protein